MKRKLSFILAAIIALGIFLPSGRVEAATLTSKAGAVTTGGGSLNVRSSASTSGSVVASLKKGSYITLLSRSGSWWQVEYANKQYGYCHSDYITVVQGTPVTVATQWGALNVRSGPGTSYARVASLPKGEPVLLLTSSGVWSRILYHGTKTGYVSSQYLSSGQIAGYGSISLSVPGFKQTDSRWAQTPVGTSGKTMAQIGCATTAIAMMESYRTGTTVYPDAMSRKLRYTPSGNVYWPDHFVTVTQSAGYLESVYRLLQQGKPVLFGAKNAYGGQHWVVITGFAGGSLTAGNFTIQDPGTYTRTNLGQFLAAYPTFYKYFHY